jgi:hypothetical protein
MRLKFGSQSQVVNGAKIGWPRPECGSGGSGFVMVPLRYLLFSLGRRDTGLSAGNEGLKLGDDHGNQEEARGKAGKEN